MKPEKKLTILDRTLIANQNKILAFLDSDEQNHYNHLAEIAERGYEGLYYELFEHVYEGTSEEVCKETFDILTMFRVISNLIAKLTPDEKANINLDKIQFEGFDANNDDHYGFMEFLIEKEGKYKELREVYRNSHDSLTISKYRTMLEVYNRNKRNLTLDNLKEMINIV